MTQNEFDELGKVYYDSFKVSRVHSGEISTRFLSDTTLNCGANYKRLTSHPSLLACSHGVLTWGRPTWNNHSISVFIVFLNKIEVRFSSVPLDLNQRSDSVRPPPSEIQTQPTHLGRVTWEEQRNHRSDSDQGHMLISCPHHIQSPKIHVASGGKKNRQITSRLFLGCLPMGPTPPIINKAIGNTKPTPQ